MTSTTRKVLTAVLVLAGTLTIAGSAEAANHYIRQGASGNGSDWTNACGGFSGSCAVSAMVRGDVYYVADGSYGNITLDKAASGSSTITIKKATSADHGTGTGWSDSFGDGQAAFGTIYAITNYWVFDGQTRDENNWSNTAAYGFRVNGEVYAHTINYGTGSSNMTFRYMDVGGAPSANWAAGNPDHGFYLGGFGQVLSNWTISRSHIHNVNRVPFQLAGASNITIEYSWLGPNWNKETIRGQIRASNIVIRHNVLKNGCQNGPAAEGCTADIGMWDGGSGAFDGSQIYGNLIWRTVATWVSDGVIFIGGDGGATAAGASANNVVVYNNTIVTASLLGNQNIRFPGSHTGNIARNNVWHVSAGANTGCSANVCDNNSVFNTLLSLVSNLLSDLRLTSPLPGVSLPSPFDVDMKGNRRGADGVWDRGAFEFGGTGGAATPTAPSGLHIISSSQQ
jgi:hypothetical protein